MSNARFFQSPASFGRAVSALKPPLCGSDGRPSAQVAVLFSDIESYLRFLGVRPEPTGRWHFSLNILSAEYLDRAPALSALSGRATAALIHLSGPKLKLTSASTDVDHALSAGMGVVWEAADLGSWAVEHDPDATHAPLAWVTATGDQPSPSVDPLRSL
ncbi:MAG TPA: hypothetical protein VEY30_04265 [Myxococcaceae bacterium]|nr:hypothetical protein [Myxococcaceae bacterium]